MKASVINLDNKSVGELELDDEEQEDFDVFATE